MPVHNYSNWNQRLSDGVDQIEPYRRYVFICEGANTETFYFKRLIDLRKELGIHPMIDVCLWEKEGKDRNISYPRWLLEYAEEQKLVQDFDCDHDRMIIVFDADIFETRVSGYDQLILDIESRGNIAGVTNPGFEVFLLLHVEDAYRKYIQGHEEEFFALTENSMKYPYQQLLAATGMNSKTNPRIGDLAERVVDAIREEEYINQDVHNVKGRISSNVGHIIQGIMDDQLVGRELL